MFPVIKGKNTQFLAGGLRERRGGGGAAAGQPAVPPTQPSPQRATATALCHNSK